MSTENPVIQLSEAFEGLKSDNIALKEELNLVQAQFAHLKAEDQGWISLLGGDGFEQSTGLSLDTLKEVSEQLREGVAGSSFPKQANDLRYSYTFSKAFVIPGVDQDADSPPKPGKKPALQEFFDNPLNQRYAFSEEAQMGMNAATSTDGMYLFLGDDATKSGRAIPISEIGAVYLNPDFKDEVWAYRRDWSSVDPSGKVEQMQRWYFTDRFTGKLPDTIGPKEDKVKVDKTKTIIDFKANIQLSWALGIPDLMAAHIWNKKYLTMMAHGEEVSAVLATYAAKVRQSTAKGAQAAGVKMQGASAGGPKAFVHGEGNTIDLFQSLGKTYDFDGLRPIASMYAAAAGVSVVDLTASPASAGSSYGAAASLQPGQRRSIEARREQWAAWYERIIKWGTGKDVKVTPEPLDETDQYRKSQIAALAWNTGLVHADEVRPSLLKIAGLTSKHSKAPEGVLMPNNKDSWERADIDPKDGPGVPTTAASPDQGQSNGSGGMSSTDKNDMRTDKIGEMLNQFRDNELLEKIESLVERLESATGQK